MGARVEDCACHPATAAGLTYNPIPHAPVNASVMVFLKLVKREKSLLMYYPVCVKNSLHRLSFLRSLASLHHPV